MPEKISSSSGKYCVAASEKVMSALKISLKEPASDIKTIACPDGETKTISKSSDQS